MILTEICPSHPPHQVQFEVKWALMDAASSASSDQEASRMNYDSSVRNSFKGFVKFHKIKNANFKKQYIIFYFKTFCTWREVTKHINHTQMGPYKDRLLFLYSAELVYLVTALVPSETACLESSPGRRSLTAV